MILKHHILINYHLRLNSKSCFTLAVNPVHLLEEVKSSIVGNLNHLVMTCKLEQ